ncbi:MAG: M23 family metallopeptidase [Candidatus Latescibacterota bacterium]|nr:MAG: M23 family metallopeptidase [Candidatus Latescibacterota bacterium]
MNAWLRTSLFAAAAIIGVGLGFLSDTPKVSGAATGVERPWPLDIPIHLSSTFGEFRPGHFHAGVDIRTFGREGVPCRAVGDGWISRLRASPFGYGKAAYLTLGSGEIVVYAHLSEFSPELDSVVWHAQQGVGRYRIDIYPDAGTLPVRQGEILGYTGRTGASAPHLHFEVRDRDQNPLNPLSIGWSLNDAEPPRILGVGWIPLTPASRIDGMCHPTIGDLDQAAAGLFTAVDTVRIDGRVGLSARIIDRLDESSGKLAPYRVELYIDGILATRIELEEFTYSHTGEVELAYNMERARAAGRHYLFLFERDGESLWNRFYRNGGVIDADSLASPGVGAPHPSNDQSNVSPQDSPKPTAGSRGVHMAEIRAFDRGGNISVALLPFVIEDDASASRPLPVPPPLVHVSDSELPGCYFLGDLLSVHKDVIAWRTIAPGPEGRLAQPAVRNGTLPDRLTGHWVDKVRDAAGPWVFGISRRDGAQSVSLFPVTKGEIIAGSYVLDNGGRVFFGTLEESFYSDTFVYLTEWRGRIDQTDYPAEEIVPVTGAARLGPLALVCKGSIELGFMTDQAGDGREAVFRFQGRTKEWSFVSSFVRTDTVSAYIGSPGVYAVFRDTLAPRIDDAFVASRRSYATGTATPELVIPIEDEGSGLDYEKTEVYIDETKQIARWDGFVQKMFVLLRNQNIIGEHNLRVVAADRVGNTSQTVSKFRVTVGPTNDASGDAPVDKPADADEPFGAPADSSTNAPRTGDNRGEARHNAP